MAKWRPCMTRMYLPQHVARRESGSVAPAERRLSGNSSRERTRVRYDSRIDKPQGWRSSFMSY